MRINEDAENILYPFMKVGAPVSELHKLDGLYFNPRQLSEITVLAVNNGTQV
jgi:hypothetical protein